MSSLFGNRLRIANHSSEVKASIDALVATHVADNQNDQTEIDKINKLREEWLKEVDECEAHNMADVEKRDDKDLELTNAELFKRFCFVFEFNGDVTETGRFTGRFISTDTYLSPNQVACFQVVVSFMKYIATNATMKKCHSRALRHF
jgi:hypothetical protein